MAGKQFLQLAPAGAVHGFAVDWRQRRFASGDAIQHRQFHRDAVSVEAIGRDADLPVAAVTQAAFEDVVRDAVFVEEISDFLGGVRREQQLDGAVIGYGARQYGAHQPWLKTIQKIHGLEGELAQAPLSGRQGLGMEQFQVFLQGHFNFVVGGPMTVVVVESEAIAGAALGSVEITYTLIGHEARGLGTDAAALLITVVGGA